MNTTATRSCIRGCMQRDEHFAACLDRNGTPSPGCKGCLPAEARDGDLLCARCYGRTLGALYDAPDLVGAIRARANPLKANVYDKVMVSGSLADGIPAPVAADLIEASDDLTRGLQGWADWAVPGSVPTHRGLRAGAEADDAQQLVLEATSVLVKALSTIANEADHIVELCRYLLEDIPAIHGDWCTDADGRPTTGCDGCVQQQRWTVHSALTKWPLVDRAWWAAQPCPYCSLRSIRVKPPRRIGHPTIFECQGCHWTRTDEDTDGPWAVAFSKRSGERLR